MRYLQDTANTWFFTRATGRIVEQKRAHCVWKLPRYCRKNVNRWLSPTDRTHRIVTFVYILQFSLVEAEVIIPTPIRADFEKRRRPHRCRTRHSHAGKLDAAGKCARRARILQFSPVRSAVSRRVHAPRIMQRIIDREFTFWLKPKLC